ncbi:MAG TPA: VOC family protein [Dehalococcoidia bacterium]|nr:VOC family protein [Dehalococcoidia bacterium]
MPDSKFEIDHVVINVRVDIDEAAKIFGRLGFTLTPKGYHTLGSVNHLAMFDTNYLELIGVPTENQQKRADMMMAPLGIDGLVFKTNDIDETYKLLQNLDMDGDPPKAFGRPVALENSIVDAQFKTVTVRSDVFPAGRVYFCEHGTPDLVWRPEWQHHVNQTVHAKEMVIVSQNAEKTAEDCAQLVQGEVQNPELGAYHINLINSRLTVYTPDVYVAKYGDIATSIGDRSMIFGALRFIVSDLSVIRNLVLNLATQVTSVEHDQSLFVRLNTFDTLIEFIER